jgi:hypothetical protein
MKSSKSNRCFQHGACLVSCALAVVAVGCASGPSATKVIRDRMLAHADEYRRVEVMPVWFMGSARIDPSLTTNDLRALSRQVGTNLLKALKEVFTEKGYVVQTSLVLSDETDLACFGPETRQLLAQVRTNFINLRQELDANRPNRTGRSLEYTAEMSVTGLREKLGLTDADLLALVESQAFFESPDARHKRHHWNWTGGAALMPLFVAFSAAAVSGGGGPPRIPLESFPGWMRHTILIVDARTREVLFYNGRHFPGEDARNPDALRDKLKDTLVDLAQLPKQK